MNVLLDLDGTLTDPLPGVAGSIRYALEAMGFPAPEAQDLKWCIGPALDGSFKKLLGTDSQEDVRRAIGLYRERYSSVGLFENAEYEGVHSVLGALREAGHTLHLATSKPRVYAVRIVKRFGIAPWLHSVHGSELDGTRVDKTDLLAHILREESLDPRESVMVGDRFLDIAGAIANSIASIGVLWGYGSRQELEEAGAEKLADSPCDLPRLVARS